ncbi:MAG: Dph6-related ATP pyrophosphatase [Flavisolibacter sp.]
MKAFLNWSGGKDSAFCLYKALKQNINIQALVTSMNNNTNRVSMHGVRRTLIQEQASSIQLPLHTIELPEQPGMEEYEKAISQTNQQLKEKGFTHAISGDLFLEDLKSYREKLYEKDQIECLFPLWKTDTDKLLEEFIFLGFKAVVVCVNSFLLDQKFCGRIIDHDFINDLPSHVDPCGENGEYHSFVFDGPLFSKPIQFDLGEIVYREYKGPRLTGFYFQEICHSGIVNRKT